MRAEAVDDQQRDGHRYREAIFAGAHERRLREFFDEAIAAAAITL